MEISYNIHLVKNDLRELGSEEIVVWRKKRKIVKYFLFGSQILNFENALVSTNLAILFDDVNVCRMNGPSDNFNSVSNLHKIVRCNKCRWRFRTLFI
jgi:hypothetical protein